VAPAVTKRRPKRRSSPDRDPLPAQRGGRGPRPGAFDAAAFHSVLEYALELPTAILANALALQRVLVALKRGLRGTLPGSEREMDNTEVRKAVYRVASVGRSVFIDERPPVPSDVDRMVTYRLDLVPTVAELRAQHRPEELETLQRELLDTLRAAAQALSDGFGEGAREHVLSAREEGARAVLEALHPKAGTKKIDKLIALNLGMKNESVVRNRRKRGPKTKVLKTTRSTHP
jgi:hypothetical protein